jgi:hypothetical protein
LGILKQTALLEFKSTAFPKEAGEDAHTNPGIFGKAMCQWLAGQLRAKGLPADDAFAEDFGWCIPIASAPHRLYVVCANAQEEHNLWRVFAFVEGGFWARFRGRDQSAASLASLFELIKSALQASAVVADLSEVAR